jgi:hypothetical protein
MVNIEEEGHNEYKNNGDRIISYIKWREIPNILSIKEKYRTENNEDNQEWIRNNFITPIFINEKKIYGKKYCQ